MADLPTIPVAEEEPAVTPQPTPTVDPVTASDVPGELVSEVAAEPAPAGGLYLQITPTPETPKPETNVGEIPGQDGDDDLTSSYTDYRNQLTEEALVEQAHSEFGGKRDPMAEEGATPPPVPVKSQGDNSSIALDIMHGVAESPHAIAGGIRNAFQAQIELADEVGEWVKGKLPDWLSGGLVSDEDGTRLLGGEEYGKWKKEKGVTKDLPSLPEVNPPKSVTGGVISGIAQFLTGFMMAGKGMRGIPAATGKAGKLATASAKGFAADFTSFDGHEKNLANLLKEHTDLAKPVLDFLATSPDDTEAENRLKNAVIGLGLGAGTEAVTEGFIKSLKYIRSGRASKALDNLAAKVFGENVKPPEVTVQDFHPLGNPESRDYFVKKTAAELDESAARSGELQPSQVTGKRKKGPEREINWSRIETMDDVKNLMRKMLKLGDDEVVSSTRGKRSHGETLQAAEQENAWKLLMERRKGDAMNAEEIVASKKLWIASGEKLAELAKLAKSAPSDVNILMFRKMAAIHRLIMANFMGARAEAGRALEALKIPVGSGREMAMQMDAILESTGGSAVGLSMAKKIADLAEKGAIGKLDKFVEGTWGAKTRAAVAKWWINSLLSNPVTHVANFTSNFATAFQQIGERRAAEFLSQTFGTQNGVAIGESMQMMHAMVKGYRDALSALSQRIEKEGGGKVVQDFFWKDAEAGAGVAGKFEGAAVEQVATSSDTFLGQALDFADHATATPGRLLTKADMLFKSIGYRMELEAQALRRASEDLRAGKIQPDQFKLRMAEIIENPPTDIRVEAIKQSTYQTFTGKPAATLKAVGDAIHKVPVLGRLMLPFKNTPINLFTYGMERTPLAPLVKAWRADIAAGGAKRDIALARMATGTMVMVTTMDLALQGHITGKGPEDPVERQNWERTHRPYSVRVGDTWVSYNRFEPIGSTLGMAADLAEAIVNAEDEISDHDFEEAMSAAVFATSNNVLSKTYMQGTAELMGAITNAQMKKESYVKRLLGSTVPAGVAAVTRAIDPYQRAADTYIDAIRRRVPGLSMGLPLARNLWGEPISYRSPAGVAFDMVSPVYLKTIKPSPIDKELEALQYFPDMPDKNIRVGGDSKGIRMNAEQYSRYVELSGNAWKHPAWQLGCRDFLDRLVDGKHPMSAVYEQKKTWDSKYGTTTAKDYIHSIMSEYRDGARKQVIREFPAIQAATDERKIKQPGFIPTKTLLGPQ